MVCQLGEARKLREPCSVVIFGASGDLTARKLVPALYHLFKEGQMPPAFRIIGFARREKTEAGWRQELRADLNRFSRTQPIDERAWTDFSANVHYLQGDLNDPAAYKRLEQQLGGFGDPQLRQNLLYYLATQPSQFGLTIEHLHRAGLVGKANGTAATGWQRIVIEKPFGHDLASAHNLNTELTRYVSEHQILRIDHYLGKETVQNILMFQIGRASCRERVL